MIESKSGEQAGWALPTTFFALAIMLSTMYVLSLESIDALGIATEPRRSERLHAAIAATVSDSPPFTQRCGNLTVAYEGLEVPYEVCRESVRPFMTEPASIALPLQPIDYDLIFSRASECSSKPLATKFHDMLSPFAPRDCPLSSAVGAPVVTIDNLVGDSVTVNSVGAPIATLATPGRVHISQELRLSSDLLVLAGGDVVISAIRALPTQSIKVTVVSALGAIRIGFIEGDVSLLMAGRGELSAPATPPTRDYPLPPFRVASIYGLRPAY